MRNYKIFAFTTLLLAFNCFGQLPGCATTVNTFPYLEDFETGTGNWNNIGGDNFDWTRDSGGTPSFGTGPATGSGDTWYMFIETSYPRVNGDEAFLESDCFDMSTLALPSISFDYHMLGAAINTLNLEISTDGVIYTNIFSSTAAIGDVWNTTTINLSAYAGQTVGFRFTGIRGTSWSGDIAIDKISIEELVPMTYTSSTTTQSSTADIVQCFTGQQIIGMEVNISGNTSPIDLTQFDLDFGNSTTISDIDSYTIYYTGSSNTFNTANTFSTGAVGTTTLSANGTQTLENVNYFWLVVDLNFAATIGNTVDVECLNIEVDGTTYAPTVTDPLGSRTIIECPPGPGGAGEGMQFWVMADKGTTGTAPVTAWANQSLSTTIPEVNATAGNQLFSNQPTMNFNSYIDLDGTSTAAFRYELANYSSLGISDELTMIIVKTGGTDLSFGVVGSTTTFPPEANLYQWQTFGFRHGGIGATFSRGDLLSNRVTYPAFTAQNNNIYAMKGTENGEGLVSINTVQNTNANIGAFSTYSNAIEVSIGTWPGYHSNDNFCEAMIWNRSLNTTELRQAESYLAIKYGLTLGTNGTSMDYLNSNNTAVWDQSLNSGYAYDIAGIARDDDSGLDQRKSHSVNGTWPAFDDIVTIANGVSFTKSAKAISSFTADESALIWGHDNEAIFNNGNGDFGLTDNGEVIETRIDRVWKSQESGTVGSVIIEVDMSQTFGTAGPGTNDLSELRLLVDEDATFLTNATSIAPTSFDNTTNLAYFVHDFQGGSGIGRGFFFTFGSVNKSTAPLPIELLTTSYDCSDYSGMLNWSTATETSTDYYVIETSKDGVDFERDNIINAAGNSSSLSEYSSAFSKEAKYVRLKLVNIDGVEEVIRVLSVDCGSGTVSIHPNPTKDILFINGLLGSASYSVYSSTGRIIFENLTSPELDLSSFSTGVYLLRVENNGKIITHKVVKN